ncbi:MAG TPA: hypothetical protein VK540_30855 [Polyangiaceae bacterium]|nr:hypothetical protein [Polyangiaceae bacterium]
MSRVADRGVSRWFVCAVVAVLLFARGLHAEAPESPPRPPPDSWVSQLEALGTWVAKRKGAACSERCFALTRLRLGGSVNSGNLKFELEGNLLVDGTFPVPLFGSPAHVRIEQATESGKPAPIGFEGTHYFYAATSRRFVLKGTLALDEDRALSIPGPLNTLEADLSDGRCVEGARLSGLTGVTIHFDRAITGQPSAEPTVFQLSRAVRVGREIDFEYKLVMRSGADLGVVRLPLAFGERVLDVSGAGGFRVDGTTLLLPTAGHSADIRISGTLPHVGSFQPDERSPYEWWLFESDAEHRVTVKGDARQIDSAESPIPRKLPTSRLYLAQRGQKLDVSIQTLSSVDVLAAVVRSHERMVVLTRKGDLVSDETLGYENNGIDYLFMDPDGRPIYLATDGKAERIMHKEKGAEEVMVPLRTGSHSVHLQALAQTGIGGLFGRIDVPLATYPLMASRVGVRLGLPALIYPLAFLGGDRPEWFLDQGDFVALAIAALVACLALRGWLRRALAAVVLAGLWFIAEALFVAVIGCIVLGALFWMLGRLLSGKKLLLAVALVVMGGGFLLLVALVGVVMRPGTDAKQHHEPMPASAPAEVSAEMREQGAASGAGAAMDDAPTGTKTKGEAYARRGNFMAQDAAGGVLEGVTPVALTLPQYERSVYATRELVTRERPFRPVLVYATAWAAWPLGMGWLLCMAGLLWIYRPLLRALAMRVRARLARGSAAPSVGSPPDAPTAT